MHLCRKYLAQMKGEMAWIFIRVQGTQNRKKKKFLKVKELEIQQQNKLSCTVDFHFSFGFKGASTLSGRKFVLSKHLLWGVGDVQEAIVVLLHRVDLGERGGGAGHGTLVHDQVKCLRIVQLKSPPGKEQIWVNLTIKLLNFMHHHTALSALREGQILSQSDHQISCTITRH